MLKTNLEVMTKARAGGYAVPAFNTNNLEITQAIFEAAAEEKSPVIVATSEGAIKYAGIENIVSMAKNLADRYGVTATLHLDHGTTIESALQCIRAGYTSVMIDGSHHPLDENIHLTQEVVRIAHAVGVSVEAELGRLKGIEDNIVVSEADAFLTLPSEAKQFVEATKCDTLAVAIGTSHGAYKGKGPAKLDFDRLKEIVNLIPATPIVLHGASGVPPELIAELNSLGSNFKDTGGVGDDSIQKAISLGVCKINIDTDMRLAFTLAIKKAMAANPNEFDLRKIFGPGKDAMKAMAKGKMRLFGSSGKA